MKKRFPLFAVGFGLIVVGLLRMAGGQYVLTHWTGQPLFSVGLITGGVLVIVLGLLPARWIERAAKVHRRSRTKPHRDSL